MSAFMPLDGGSPDREGFEVVHDDGLAVDRGLGPASTNEDAEPHMSGGTELRWRVMNDQMNGFIKEITAIRGDIRSIRVATHRGFKDLERQLGQQCQDVVTTLQAEVEMRANLEQHLNELHDSFEKADRPSAAIEQPVSESVNLETHRRLEALQEEMRTLILETDRKMAAFSERSNMEEEMSTLTLETDRKMAAFREELDQEARNREATSMQAEMAAFREELDREARNREANGTQLAQQLHELSESIENQAEQTALRDDALERQAGLAALRTLELQGAGSGDEPSENVLTDLRDVSHQVDAERSERTKEMSSMTLQVKDLRLCLEAEVGARSAITERLHRELHEIRSRLDIEKADRSSGNKASKESLHDVGQALQSRMQMLEASIQDVKTLRDDLLSRKDVDESCTTTRKGGSSSLEVEVLREGLNNLEAQAKRHVSWVEAQADKHASRQELLENSIVQEAKARAALDEELRQVLGDELNTQAKFFQGELRGLLASAHSSWTNESQQLWNALGQQSSELSSSRDSSWLLGAEPTSTSKDSFGAKGCIPSKKELSEIRSDRASPPASPNSRLRGNSMTVPSNAIAASASTTAAAVSAARSAQAASSRLDSGSRVTAPTEAGPPQTGKPARTPLMNFKNVQNNAQSTQQRPGGAGASSMLGAKPSPRQFPCTGDRPVDQGGGSHRGSSGVQIAPASRPAGSASVLFGQAAQGTRTATTPARASPPPDPEAMKRPMKVGPTASPPASSSFSGSLPSDSSALTSSRQSKTTLGAPPQRTNDLFNRPSSISGTASPAGLRPNHVSSTHEEGSSSSFMFKAQ